MPSSALIAEFVTDYSGLNPHLRAADLELVEDALIEFLMMEQWLNNPVEKAALETLAKIETLLPPNSIARALVPALKSSVKGICAELQRLDHANHMMREDLTMMSEQIRRLESAD